jgi:hypothetical protein
MTWSTVDDNKYDHARREIDKQSHRGVAIIATAIVQDHLVLAIRGRLTNDLQIQNKLLSIGGALNDFGTQIDFGYLLGLYSNIWRSKLHIAKDIRNDFAHKMDPMSFKFHRDRCKRLLPPKSAHKQVNDAVNLAHGDPTIRLVYSSFKRSKLPRTQFVRFCQQITMLLTWEIVIDQQRASQRQ